MVFRVADNGGGIAPDRLETIFGRFVTSDEGLEAKGGMGLGLSICRAIVEAHGGTIVARNNDEGGGTARCADVAEAAREETPGEAGDVR